MVITKNELRVVGDDIHTRRRGVRGIDFRSFLMRTIAARTTVSTICARMLVCDRYEDTWSMAFTHSSFDAVDNYKMFEQCGDATIHHFIKNHILDRLPHFRRFPVKYVGVVENINQRCVSRAGLSVLARDLGFAPYISYDNTDSVLAESGGYAKPLSKMLEDTFESFIGALETIVDEHVGMKGAGFAVCSEFLDDLFTTHPKFADLEDHLHHLDVYPAKTVMLELAKDPMLKNILSADFSCTRKRESTRFPREPHEESAVSDSPQGFATGLHGSYISEFRVRVLSDFGAPVCKTFTGEDRCKKPAEELAAARALKFLVARGTLAGTKYLTNYADPTVSVS